MTIRSKQLVVLDFIKQFIAEHGFSPTIREISEGLGLNSHSGIQEHLHKLSLAGLITMNKNKSRTIELLVENEYIKKEEIVSIEIYPSLNDKVEYIKVPEFLIENNKVKDLIAYQKNNSIFIINKIQNEIDKPSLTHLENEFFIEEKPEHTIVGNIVCELKKYK